MKPDKTQIIITIALVPLILLAWLFHIITYPYYKLTEKKRRAEAREDREKFEREFSDYI